MKSPHLLTNINIQEPTIHQPPFSKLPLQCLQNESIVSMTSCNLERSFPQMIELPMLYLVLIPNIPLLYQIINLEIFLFGPFIKNLLHLFLKQL